MNPLRCIIVGFSLFFVNFSFAATFVCPNAYRPVVTGDSIQQVISVCGKPMKVLTKDSSQTESLLFKRWIYVANSGPLARLNARSPQLIITFQHNKVIQIKTRSLNNTNPFPCYQMKRVAIGNTSQQVMFACGAPDYVSNIQQGVNQPVKVTTLIYNFGEYRPKMMFIFENKKLIDIRMDRGR